MKRKNLVMLLGVSTLLNLLAVSCKDNDDNRTTADIELQMDTEITEVINHLKSAGDIYVSQENLTDEHTAVAHGHYVHYFGNGTTGVLMPDIYKEALESGHYFLVSEKNATALSSLLGYNFQASPNTEDEVDAIFTNHTENKAEPDVVLTNPADTVKHINSLSGYGDDEIPYKSSITPPASSRFPAAPRPVFYYLFNKNAEMIVAIPQDGHLPAMTAQAMIATIHKYKNDKPSTRGGINLDAQIVCYSWQYSYSYPSGWTNSQQVSATYEITGCYSYTQNRDYYLVTGEVVTWNAQLGAHRGVAKNYANLTSDKLAYYEGYSKGLNMKAVLGARSYEALGTPNSEKFHFMNAQPGTTTGSTSFTTGVSYNISGNIGGNAAGPTGGISGGVTLSSTRTTSIPDVEVKNVCGSAADGKVNDPRYTEWQFRIANPRQHSDYTNTGNCRWMIDDVKDIGKTTATYQTAHIWTVEQPTTGFNPIIAIRAEVETGWSAGHQNWLGSQHWWWCEVRPNSSWFVINLWPVKRN
jgi:hypothetical protein